PAILLLSFLIYRRESDTASARTRSFLATLRAVVLLLAVFVYFRPVCVTTQYDKIKPVAAGLIDDSASMMRSEDYGDSDVAQELASTAGLAGSEELKDLTRRDLVMKSFAHDNLVAKLSETFDVRLYAFDEESRLLKDASDLHAEGQ